MFTDDCCHICLHKWYAPNKYQINKNLVLLQPKNRKSRFCTLMQLSPHKNPSHHSKRWRTPKPLHLFRGDPLTFVFCETRLRVASFCGCKYSDIVYVNCIFVYTCILNSICYDDYDVCIKASIYIYVFAHDLEMLHSILVDPHWTKQLLFCNWKVWHNYRILNYRL